ncbi:Mobile element protein [hydrothermal vent metagenome]|uniref:Mobile element protein n=1 Tax=hydrothermal vent metagenome TaxID=652676 RepID=A0A1W1C0E6_9ZZZZ
MKKSVEKDLKKIEEKIEIDFKKLQFTEKNPNNNENMLKPPTVIKLLKINKRKEKLEKDLDFLEKNNLTQYNRTDPDAKLMVKPAHNLMAYNVQIAVDGKYKFIVATDISSVGQDTNQLYNMASKSKDVLGQEKMNIIADKGYYNTNEIKKCIDNNITPFLSTPKYKQPKGELFTADKFEYDEEKDCYRCPNNQELTKASFTQDRGGRTNSVYQGSASKCKNCPLREKCIPAKTACKRIYRWEHQKMLEQHQSKMETDKAKEIIKKRGSIVEHPFGTIKQTLGWTHFLVRGKVKVTGENALIMFTYNFRRLINLIGIALFKKVLKALKNGNIEAIKAEIVAYIAMLLHIWVYFLGRIKFYSYKEEKLSFRLRDTPFEHLLRFS